MWQLSRRAARECCGLSDAVPAWLSIRSSMHLPAVLLTLTPLLPLQIARAQETGTIAGVVRARETGVPLWDARVTVAGTPPEVVPGQPVQVLGLIAFPWQQDGRSGVAYRADAIEPLKAHRAA